jgi:hypothetical protein
MVAVCWRALCLTSDGWSGATYLALIPVAVLVGNFLTWQEERVDRNKVAIDVAGLNGEIARLNSVLIG